MKPGDIVRIRPTATMHILEEHSTCDERCFDARIEHVALVISKVFEPDIDFRDEGSKYEEVVVVGPLGTASVDVNEILKF